MSTIKSIIEDIWNAILSLIRKKEKEKEGPKIPDKFSTSLFFYNPGFRQSWDFFSELTTDNDRKACINHIKSLGGNCIIFLSYKWNPDSNLKGRTLLYKSTTDRNWDEEKCQWFKKLCEELYYEHQLHLFITLREDHTFDGDNWSEYERRFKKVHELIGHLKPYYLLGLESSEYWDVKENITDHNEAFNRVRKHTDRPIGTHIQWRFNERSWPGKCEFIAYEHSWDPNKGGDMSAQKCVDELKAAINKSGGRGIIASEFSTRTLEQRYKDQRNAMLSVPNCMGVG